MNTTVKNKRSATVQPIPKSEYERNVMNSKSPKPGGKFYTWINSGTGDKVEIQEDKFGDYKAKGYEDERVINGKKSIPKQKSDNAKEDLHSQSDSHQNKELKQEVSRWEIVEDYFNSRYEFMDNVVKKTVHYREIGEAEYKEVVVNDLYRDLQLKRIKFPKQDIEAMLGSNFVRKYDPFVDYFENLKWDFNDHINDLSNHIELMNNESDLFKYHFKKALIRNVACAIKKDYFNKHAFIIVGKKQNTGKSTFLNFLVPPKLKLYYTETVIANTKNDELRLLSENFIINLEELAYLAKHDPNHVKNIISAQIVNVRHPYDRSNTTSPRRANFWGSTNDEEFLNDPTGSSRFICFEIKSINWNYKNTIDIDQVWAQAYFLYKNGEPYGLSREEVDENEIRNQTHQRTSVEIEIIQRLYTPGNREDYDFKYNATDILNEINKLVHFRNYMNVGTIGRALITLGFERGQERRGEKSMPIKVYYLKKSDDYSTTLLQIPEILDNPM